MDISQVSVKKMYPIVSGIHTLKIFFCAIPILCSLYLLVLDVCSHGKVFSLQGIVAETYATLTEIENNVGKFVDGELLNLLELSQCNHGWW